MKHLYTISKSVKGNSNSIIGWTLIFLMMSFSGILMGQSFKPLVTTSPAMIENVVSLNAGSMLSISIPNTEPGQKFRIQRTYPADQSFIIVTSNGGTFKVPGIQVKGSGEMILSIFGIEGNQFAYSFEVNALPNPFAMGSGSSPELFPSSGNESDNPMTGESLTVVPGLVSNLATICSGGSVQVSINNSDLGKTYRLWQTYPSVAYQDLPGNGGTLTFPAYTVVVPGSGDAIINVFATDFSWSSSFNVHIVPQPTAPTLTLSQAEGTVCAGPNISASFLAAGTGGYNCNDSYEYSLDGGLTWNPYTLGTGIPTTTFNLNSVKIKAKRSDNEGRSCNAENIYTWTIQSYVHDITGPDKGSYCTIQQAIDAANTVNGDVLEVDYRAAAYDEQVLVNKEVTLKGVGGQPIIDFSGTVSGKPTLFDVSANNVTIDNLYFKVDLSKLRSAVIVSAAGIDNITIKNNLVDPYGTPSGTYGERNAFSINYAGYRVATGGVDNISFTDNTVNAGTYPIMFRSGISVDEGEGTFTGNVLKTISSDILVRFAGNGNVTVSGNYANGAGMEFADFNAGTGTLSITGNFFDGTFANTYSNALRLKNNYTARTTVVSGNTFTGFVGNIAGAGGTVSLENYQAITLDGNTFTPPTGSTTFRHLTINTKDFSSSSGYYAPVINAVITNNTFNGSGTPGGMAIGFYNWDNDSPVIGPFTLGSAGNENIFNTGIGTVIHLDNSVGTAAPNATSMVCWATNLNAEYNKFDVGSGLQLPGAMNFTERTALEAKLFHKPDVSCLGFITTFFPVHNLTQNTYYLSIQSAVTAANANDVIECAEYTYNERVVIDKSLTLQGVNEANCIIDGTGLSGNGKGITINSGVTGVTLKYLTVQNFAGASGNADGGIYAVGGNNNLTVQHVTIKNNVGGSGFYANGPVTNVLLDYVTSFGHTVGARGIVIWNGLKDNITITNCNVYGNNCCGIELQDGTATGVTMLNNNVHDNGDNGFGLTGLQGPGENIISNNTVKDNGRFGIEIKNPNGSGLATGAGRVVVENNNVSRTTTIVDARDIAGIAAFRRGVLAENVDVPTGAVIQNNTVTGYTQPSTSDGFGIVVEGTNHTVLGNTVGGCDVGIQQQVNPSNYPGDADANNLPDTYFGRGNSPISCGNEIIGNTFGPTANTVDSRNVGAIGGTGFVTNVVTGKTFCSIQAAIDDAATLNGHTLQLSAGTFNEAIVVTKSVTITGAGKGSNPLSNTIISAPVLCAGVGFTISSSNVTLSQMYVAGFSQAVLISGVNNSTISNMSLIDYCMYGVNLAGNNNNVQILQTEMIHTTAPSGTVVGIRTGTGNALTGLLVDGCTINGNIQGVFFCSRYLFISM
ncbi:MAG: right-handed parallel beta-helix repeat-containing protein [Bacteroidales bacterium]|nr:right-handed parallel beta-helix repeat-containing protein [Bacteroidales bacterium]